MLFNSLTFCVFLAIVLPLHRLMPSWTSRKVVLLAASYVFYAAWNPPYVLILLGSTTLDWWLARLIWRCDNLIRRKQLLLLSLVVNLGLLGFFKYAAFFLDNTSAMLATFGIVYAAPMWNIVLPVGISFYTFASLSYTIDVYRREIDADSSFLDYALFVSFFPHLVAGPIVRAKMLLPQLRLPRLPSSRQLGWGLTLVIIGLFCKTVLADSVFAPPVDQVFYAAHDYGAIDVWAVTAGFSAQIYYDFGGYSLCAIGLALCFGFTFPDNFRYPYAARGFADFWRRWHITLSSWLRDYLYIPLGGNRGGELSTYRNLFLTMLIGGVWHGASWMFVLWGGLHAVYLTVERLLTRPGDVAVSKGPRVGMTLLTCLLVTLAWIPFRAADLGVVDAMVSGLVRMSAPSSLDLWQRLFCYLGMALTIAWHFVMRDRCLENAFARLNRTMRCVVLTMCLTGIFLASGGDERAFIYFQF